MKYIKINKTISFAIVGAVSLSNLTRNSELDLKGRLRIYNHLSFILNILLI